MEDKDQLDASSEVGEEEEEDFATLFAKYEETRPQLKPGQVVEGKIVGIYDNELLVDAGGRAEATLQKDEIKGPDGKLLFGMGDSVSVMLEGSADSDNQLKVSYKKALRAKQLTALQESIDSGKNLEGRVVEVVKGGLLADVGMRGFIPASQVDESYVEDLKPFLGKTLTLKVMQHDLPNGKLILSRRALLNEARAKKRKVTLATLAVGQRLPGVIRRILDYGVFVDIGGVEGLLHISEMSWRRIKHPSQLFKVGDHIEVAVLKYDKDRCRISLGYRKAEDDPWRNAAELYPEGTVITGTVKKLEHFGAFVELESGIQGTAAHLRDFLDPAFVPCRPGPEGQRHYRRPGDQARSLQSEDVHEPEAGYGTSLGGFCPQRRGECDSPWHCDPYGRLRAVCGSGRGG